MFRGERNFTTDEVDNVFAKQRAKGLLYTVMLSEKSVCGDWQNVHKWCKDHTDEYSWNGSYFHFKTKDEAIQFRLLWG